MRIPPPLFFLSREDITKKEKKKKTFSGEKKIKEAKPLFLDKIEGNRKEEKKKLSCVLFLERFSGWRRLGILNLAQSTDPLE
jgi:hypothetical protein